MASAGGPTLELSGNALRFSSEKVRPRQPTSTRQPRPCQHHLHHRHHSPPRDTDGVVNRAGSATTEDAQSCPSPLSPGWTRPPLQPLPIRCSLLTTGSVLSLSCDGRSCFESPSSTSAQSTSRLGVSGSGDCRHSDDLSSPWRTTASLGDVDFADRRRQRRFNHASPSPSSADEIADAARRHIWACHVPGSVKRSSRVVSGMDELLATLLSSSVTTPGRQGAFAPTGGRKSQRQQGGGWASATPRDSARDTGVTRRPSRASTSTLPSMGDYTVRGFRSVPPRYVDGTPASAASLRRSNDDVRLASRSVDASPAIHVTSLDSMRAAPKPSVNEGRP